MNNISKHQARLTGNVLNVDWSAVDFNEFLRGMNAEYKEHGPSHPETDVTNNDLIKVGKIALSHLRELPDYYTRLGKMEKEPKKESLEAPGDEVKHSEPINASVINEKLLNKLAHALGLDLTKVVGEELSKAIIEELAVMATHMTGALTSEKLARATVTAYKNLMNNPDHYASPQQKKPDGHVLAGNQFASYHNRNQRESRVLPKKLLLREVYRSELTEARKFINLAEFKKIKDPMRQYQYLVNNGESLGAGSSRHVFLINSGRVLKMAKARRDGDAPVNFELGQAQNEAEVELYTNPHVRPILAKIYEYDKDYNWLISELVRPFRRDEEFYNLTGVYIEDLHRLTDRDDAEEYLAEYYSKNKFAKEIVALIMNTSIEGADLPVAEHWGKTNDGRVVILDYGFNTEVMEKYY